MCRRFTNDEDSQISIINDGMLRVFVNIEQYEGKGNFEGWVRRIVFRSLSNYFRKENKYLKFIFMEEREKVKQSDALADLYYDDLIQVVETLPEMMKKVFKLYSIYGLAHKEIGKELDISEGTSKWHLSKAREKLREKLNNESRILSHA